MPEENVTTLLVLLRQRHWQKYSTFCQEYDKAARKVDLCLVGAAPSRAQLARWTSGSVRTLPFPDHCRVLEEMFRGWTAKQLLAKWEGERKNVGIPLQVPRGRGGHAIPGT